MNNLAERKLDKRKKIKLFLFWCTIIAFLTFSPSAFSQISVNVKNMTIRSILKDIEKKSEYRFFYNTNFADLDIRKNIDSKNEPIGTVLKKVFDGTSITWDIRENNIIVLTPSSLKQGTTQAIEKKITGTVVDTGGDPIIGASIGIKGTSKGVMSDIDGNFEITVPADAVLAITYVGYNRQEISVSNKDRLSIIMEESSRTLDEVVVVGYGVMRKSDLTGSVAKLLGDKSEEKAYTSVEQMIQGKVSGVQITQNTGAPGGGLTFNIRGANSISGSNQPLIVIDGYPVDNGENLVTIGSETTYVGSVPGGNALSSLNTNDIESIEILKDASSTAIYGSRGANGVVIITTKRGKEGKERIDYSFRTDISYVPKKMDLLNTMEYIGFSNEAYLDKNDGSVAYNNAAIDKYRGIDTNWQDLVFRTGVSQNHQLNISGGDKKMQYALSLGYLGQQGIIKNSSYDRGTVRLNLDREVNSRFKFGVNVSANMSVNKAVLQSSRAGDASSSVIGAALRTPPLYAAFGEDELINIDNQFSSPLTLIELANDESRVTGINVSTFGNYKLTPNISLNARLGANNTANQRNYYMPRGTYLGNSRGGYAYEGHNKAFNYLMEYTASFIKTIKKKHRVNAVVGYTWQSWESRSLGVSASGFPNDNDRFYNLGAGSIANKPSNSLTKWSLASFLGRVNYTFDNRYLLTLTGRYDGSTRLAEGHQWAIFPSVAVGWNIHNEKFMKPLNNKISEMKIRASYGVSGNQSVGVGSTKSLYTTSNGVVNEGLVTVYYPRNMPNENLGWENTSQYNVGLDLGFLNNRFKLSGEYYYKKTTDLLISLPIPASSGFSSYTTNAGSVENKGFEFEATARILTGGFEWTASGNISFNKNKILEFDGTLESFLAEQVSMLNNQNVHIAKIGYPIGAFYGYRVDGIYQTQSEVDNHAVDPANPRPGDFKFRDISGPDGVPDGLISAYDQEIIGNPYPDFIFGITNDFNWKNFSLNVLIQGSIGQDVINANRYLLDGLTRSSNTNISREAYENRWTGPGTSNTYPAARSMTLPYMGRFTDFIVEDASFVRLKSVTLSYTFPLKTSKLFKSIKVFCTGGNLLTITDYKGYDPEINSRGQNSLTPGLDNGSIPQYRTVSAGLNVLF